jgi:uncharacterized membrane protein YccF (DUF307 family)
VNLLVKGGFIMKVLGNIHWIIFGGLFWAISSFIAGALWCVTIIGIPVGLQLFKVAKCIVIWPFGKTVTPQKVTGFKIFLNILWIIFGGIESAIGYFLTGVLFCITIIGIPFGKQYFKMARFVLTPLGYGFE